MKGKERHHLKEDQFVSGIHRFFEFAREWRREIIIGVLILAGLGVALGAVQILKSQQARSQSRKLGEIFALRTSLASEPGKIAELEALAGKGKYGRVAAISLAAHWVGEGEYDKAANALASVKDTPRDFFHYQARDLSAQIALLRGDADGAIAILTKIAEEKPKDYILDAILFRQAEALEKKGRMDEALAMYKKVEAEYPQSYFGYDASLRARKIETARKPA